MSSCASSAWASMSSPSAGSRPASLIVPRLCGRTIPAISVNPVGESGSIHGSYIGIAKCSGWRSGTSRPGLLFANRWVCMYGIAVRRGRDLLRPVDDRREQVVVEVATDAGQVGDDVDAERAQLVGRADARGEQEARGPDRAAGDDDLALRVRGLDAPAALVLHPDAAVALEDQAPRGRLGEDRQVRVIEHRPEVRARRAVARAVLDDVLHGRDAELRVAVVVGVERDARLDRGVDHRLMERVGPDVLADLHEALDLLEERLHLRPGPAVVARVRPHVVVERVAADPDHPVQRAGAAEHAAARPLQPALHRVHLRRRPDRPVVLAVPQLVHAGDVVDGGVGVVPPASSSSTRTSPRSTSRRATTAPADPEPITITS